MLCFSLHEPIFQKVDRFLEAFYPPCFTTLQDMGARLNGGVAAWAARIMINLLAFLDPVLSLVGGCNVGDLFARPNLEQSRQIMQGVKYMPPSDLFKCIIVEKLEFDKYILGYLPVDPET